LTGDERVPDPQSRAGSGCYKEVKFREIAVQLLFRTMLT
jgi:hypothetical protein